jgi:sugar/nucleoside kinase (ribokinase family)
VIFLINTPQSGGFLVAGNGTLDAILSGNVRVESSTLIVTSEEGGGEFAIENPPVKPGKKLKTNEDLAEIIISSNLWHKYVPGGGGFNSSRALRELEGENLDLSYIDVSKPNKLFAEGLRKLQLYDSHHFWRRDMPTNVILKYKGDRLILKGAQAREYSPLIDHWQQTNHYMSGKDALFVNSIKDKDYVEMYMDIADKRNIPVFYCITSSTPWDFAKSIIFPNSTIFLNYDDLSETLEWQKTIEHRLNDVGIDPMSDAADHFEEEIRMKFALNILNEINLSKPQDKLRSYITMGKHGVYCSDEFGSYHVSLTDDYQARVDDSIKVNRGTTNGAGDYFFAAASLYSVKFPGLRATNISMKASEVAMRHIGYWGPLSPDAFKITLVQDLSSVLSKTY